MKRSLLIATVIGALLIVPAIAGADDLEDLKAAHARGIEAWNTLDAAKAVEGSHGEGVSFGVDYVTAGVGQGTAANLQNAIAYFELFENFTVIPVNFEYKIVENVGIAYGLINISYKLKDGPPTSRTQRSLIVFAKVNGEWKSVASSTAPLALGRWQ